jgi:glutaminyl-peptide cyclotransferase
MRRTAVWCRFASVAPPIVALVTAALVGGCARPREFAGARAYADVVAQCQLGPRLPGSEASAEAREYFARELRHAGWNVQEQTLVYRDVPLCNVIASKGSGPLVIVGAHYDSRATADRDQRRDTPVPGANDGASGAAVLLELARSLDAKVLQNEVWLAFFDAEDQGQIDGWPWSVGAEYLAGGLDIPPEFVIIVDMVGDADQQLYWERSSTPALSEQVWTIAAELGYEAYFQPTYKHHILDDHAPFLQRGIPALDIIDFDYPYWHTLEDTTDKVSESSLEHVGRVLERLLEGGATSPSAES